MPQAARHVIVPMDGRTSCRDRIDPAVQVRFVGPPPRGKLFTLRMAHWLRRQRPQLVLTYNWGAIESVAAARLAKVARIIHAEDGFGDDEIPNQKRRRVIARRLLLAGITRVVVPSRFLFDIARNTWHLSDERVLHIDNGVDLELFAPGSGAATRAQLDIPLTAPVVGTVAFLRPVKNTQLLLQSFAAHAPRDAFCLIVGEGPDRDHLERLAAELGIAARVRFPGRVVPAIGPYRAMDLFALSSHSEQMPIALVEAMGVGLPVLATDVGDVRWMISEPNRGYVVRRDDPHGFGLALAALLRSRDIRESLGAANRTAAVAHYDQSIMIERYRQLYGAPRESGVT
jgi:glycosyltransferase involved in cell wall biosynthesis